MRKEQERYRFYWYTACSELLSTCRLFLSLSSSFLWAPALFTLSFILHTQIWLLTIKRIHESSVTLKVEGKETKREKKRKCQTFPTRSLFPQFSLSRFWCPPPTLGFVLHLPPLHPIKHFSPGQVILLKPAPPIRPETFWILITRYFNIITQTFS